MPVSSWARILVRPRIRNPALSGLSPGWNNPGTTAKLEFRFSRHAPEAAPGTIVIDGKSDRLGVRSGVIIPFLSCYLRFRAVSYPRGCTNDR
ncbi:hypothetical protein CHELA20_50759 [Hyphomicrobiales bacterium]|nr:hypothetical protein CHELA20_50759 [Hyphomicrobiales bacterium]CAH1676502.1 hypothetical protein CHELA41_24260 [Hyphomicrobiales bacterium]